MATLSDIMDLIDGIDEAKADLKTSIAGKGVTVPAAAKLADLPDLVDEIQTGVTPTGTKSITINTNGTTTEDVTNYANAQITANVPNTYAASDEGKVVSNGALVSQTSDTVTQNGTVDTTLINSLTVNVSGGSADALLSIISREFSGRLDGPSLGITKIGERAFDHCTGITSAFLVGITKTGPTVMYSCTGLQTAVLHTSGVGTSSFFNGCSNLQSADIDASQIYGSCFAGCASLNVLVLRKTSVIPLQNINAFNNSPFASGKSGGTIYIPKTLYDHLGDGTADDYKSATNWSTVDGYGTITWAKIEGSIYETQYVDGTPIT